MDSGHVPLYIMHCMYLIFTLCLSIYVQVFLMLYTESQATSEDEPDALVLD